MKTIRKGFFNCDKEERWLNQMSESGLAFSGYTWCKYTFEDCEPGEFIYRIELLKEPVSKSADYLEFMNNLGIELVTTYGNWAYFRKSADLGKFDIYSDIDSKLLHYRRIGSIWTLIACGELSSSIYLLQGAIFSQAGSPYAFTVRLIFGSLLALVSLFFFIVGHSYRKKIKHLKKERGIRE